MNCLLRHWCLRPRFAAQRPGDSGGNPRRTIFKEVASASTLGVGLFTFVLFLQTLGKNNGFLSLLVRAAAPASTVGYLLSLVVPLVIPFTVPLGILVGILIGLSRMSSDGEITAMRAAGVPGPQNRRPGDGLRVFGNRGYRLRGALAEAVVDAGNIAW